MKEKSGLQRAVAAAKATHASKIPIPEMLKVDPEFMYGCPITGQSYASFGASDDGVVVRRRMEHVEVSFTCAFCADRHYIEIPFTPAAR